MNEKIGIDPGVNPGFALWPSAETWQIKSVGRGAERLYALHHQVRDSLLDRPDVLGEIEAVFIERPLGRWPNPALMQAAGVIQAGVLEALNEVHPYRPTVFELGTSEWKKACGLRGNATKSEVMEWAAEQWTPRPQYPERSQDEADALAIACAGHSLFSQSTPTRKAA